MRFFKKIGILTVMILLLSGCDSNNKGPDVEYLIWPQFSAIGRHFIDGVLMVAQETEAGIKQGYINEKGELIAPPIYDETRYYNGMSSESSGFSEGLAPVRKGDKWGYIDKNGREVIDFKYEEASLFSGGAAVVKIGEKCGLIDPTGKTIIEPQYDGTFTQDGVAAVLKDGLWGFIDFNGKPLLKERFEDIELPMPEEESRNFIKVLDNGLYGLVKLEDGKAEYLIEPKYTKLFPFINGRAFYVIVHRDQAGNYTEWKDYGYVDLSGRELYRWENTKLDIYKMTEDRVLAQDGSGMYGYLDTSMKVVVPFQYEEALEYCKGHAVVLMDGKYGLIDKAGSWILKPEYQSIVDMDSYFIVQDEEGAYLMDAAQQRPLSKKYGEIGRGEILKPVRLGSKVGFINLEGEEVIPPQYEDCETFAFWDDYGIVKQDGKWSYIDRNGSKLGDLSFEEARLFSDEGYAAVKNNGKWGILEKSGKLVIPFVFEEIAVQAKNWAVAMQEGKYGVIKLK